MMELHKGERMEEIFLYPPLASLLSRLMETISFSLLIFSCSFCSPLLYHVCECTHRGERIEEDPSILPSHSLLPLFFSLFSLLTSFLPTSLPHSLMHVDACTRGRSSSLSPLHRVIMFPHCSQLCECVILSLLSYLLLRFHRAHASITSHP